LYDHCEGVKGFSARIAYLTLPWDTRGREASEMLVSASAILADVVGAMNYSLTEIGCGRCDVV
jgi:hypothetical protein